MTDDQIEEIAKREVEIVHKEILRNLYGKVSKKTVLDYLEIFGNRFESFTIFNDGNKRTLATTHRVNLPFSKVYYNIAKDILALAKIETFETESDISEHGFSLVFEV